MIAIACTYLSTVSIKSSTVVAIPNSPRAYNLVERGVRAKQTVRTNGAKKGSQSNIIRDKGAHRATRLHSSRTVLTYLTRVYV